MFKVFSSLKPHLPFVAVLTALFIVGLFTYKDYGISIDEGTQRLTAWKNIDYIINDNSDFLDYPDKDYGPAFEIPLFGLELLFFDLDEYHNIYPFRHLITHLFYLVGVLFLYLLSKVLFKNNWYALISAFLFVLHPRIYAHSFFNTKDIPFLVMLIITVYFCVKAYLNKTYFWFVLAGICSGILINLRLIGAIYPLLIFSFYLFEDRKRLSRAFLKISLMLVFASVTLYLSWPYLWENPLENLFKAIENMSHFRWENDGNFFFGELLTARNLPWYYLPVWILITTPIVVLALFFVGLFFVRKHSFFRILAIGLFLPFLLVVVFNSVLYDGWRHFYFVYPLIALIAAWGLFSLAKTFNLHKMSFLIFLLACAPSLYFSIKNHPYQQVYFNEFLPKKDNYLLHNFERDYWGSSFYKGLKKLSETSYNDTIVFYSNIKVAHMNTLLFPPSKNIVFKPVSSIDSANYFITNYRWEPKPKLNGKKLFDITVQKNAIISAWKLK